MTWLAMVATVGAQPSFEVVHAFRRGPTGPLDTLVEASNGRLYGTTIAGGMFDGGTVYMIQRGADGSLPITPIYSFGASAHGNQPTVGLIEVDGALYGTTSGGGAYGYGTVFRITFDGVVSTIHSFDGVNGASPGALMRARDGLLYGSTEATVSGNGEFTTTGAIFKISTSGAFTQVHRFTGDDGAVPRGRLVQAPDGTFYGVTREGGTWAEAPFPYGTIFKLTEDGAFTRLHSFSSQSYYAPDSGLLLGADGNLYGIADNHGTGGLQTVGAVFRMTPDGSVTFIHPFSAESGAHPRLLLRDVDGSLIGVDASSVFRMTPSGTVTTLRRFSAAEGVDLRSVIKAADGRLYGVAEAGGVAERGTVFAMTVAGTLTGLNPFIVDDQPMHPIGPLVAREDGAVFGVTCRGGWLNAGTIYKRQADGALSTVHSFFFLDGFCPTSLIRGNDGYLYGVALYGGLGGRGTVFRMSDDGALVVLHAFSGADGSYPYGLMQARNGQLWGMTQYAAGGANSGGIFRMPTSGPLAAAYPLETGCRPQLGPQASDGSFFGTMRHCTATPGGTLFRMTESGAIQTLHVFDGHIAYRPGPLILASDGRLYGTAESNNDGPGAVFAADVSGSPMLIRTLASGEAERPRWGVTEGPDGLLYGTALGPDGGTVFSTTTAGAFTVVHRFPGEHRAYDPLAPLLRSPDGAMFGTTFYGGPAGQGVLFRIRPAGGSQ